MTHKFFGAKKLFLSLLFVAFMAAFSIGFVHAIAKGYLTDDKDLQPGMTVALSESSTDENPKIERASIDQDERIIGVATTVDETSVAQISAQNQVIVETGGEVSAFVSDISGEVAKGDELVISPLKGVLMKIGSDTSRVVGIAAENFSDQPSQTKTVDTNNGSKDVKVVKIKINLDNKAASNQQVEQVDSSLGRLGRSITGRNISETRVLAALIIFLMVLVAEGGIIYGTISSTIISVGRNPLAGKVIFRNITKVILIALGVLALGVLAVYLILWL